MRNGAVIPAHAVNGVFEIEPKQNKTVISFNAALIKRFSVVVAFLLDGFWRARYRFVVTLQDGMLCFPLHTTLEKENGKYRVPKEFELNTVLIIGIEAKEVESKVKMRVYANEMGSIASVFNGYEGSIGFDKFLDKATFSDNLKVKKHGGTIRFDRKLYQLSHQNQPEETPHLNFEEEWCPNCLVVSDCRQERVKPIQHYRSDVYAQMPMSVFEMRLENSNDVLYVLNKSNGRFEVMYFDAIQLWILLFIEH